MIGLLVAHEMVDGEVSFDRNQGSLPEHERGPPQRDELSSLIEEWLLNEPASVEAEIRIKIRQPLRFIGGRQRDFVCLNVNE